MWSSASSEDPEVAMDRGVIRREGASSFLHMSPLIPTMCTHPSDQELWQRVREVTRWGGLSCTHQFLTFCHGRVSREVASRSHGANVPSRSSLHPYSSEKVSAHPRSNAGYQPQSRPDRIWIIRLSILGVFQTSLYLARPGQK